MRTVAIALALLIGTPLYGQDLQPAPAPLGGPKVQPRQAPASLVERDMSGRLRRLEVPPEEAALDLLNLDAGTRAKADEIIAARNQILDQIVVDNLDLVVKFANARQAGDRAEQIALLQELSAKLQPLNARGTLSAELRSVLPREKARQLESLVSEYRRAAAEDWMAEAQARGERMSRLQANVRENLATLGLQIRRAYERTIASKAEDFEALLAQLNLRPEQESKIRTYVADFIQATRGKPTPEQRQALFVRIMGVLDPDQQRALVRSYLGHPPGT